MSTQDSAPDQPATEQPSTEGTAPADAPAADAPRAGHRVVVVSPQGVGISDPADGAEDPADLIDQPAKVMRIGTMIKQLLDEVRSAPLDDAARTRLAEIHRRSLDELEQGLAPELVDELERITLPFTDSPSPTDAELRIAQAQLVGWLEGLFRGIQTAMVAQQVAAQAHAQSQLQQGLPPGVDPRLAGQPQPPTRPTDGGTGQYL